uniref:Uncharacterized protein n=1 Tax=Knipowitschia caucasica TaxID=637954 RepID=A0AAV2J453_KNICA
MQVLSPPLTTGVPQAAVFLMNSGHQAAAPPPGHPILPHCGFFLTLSVRHLQFIIFLSELSGVGAEGTQESREVGGAPTPNTGPNTSPNTPRKDREEDREEPSPPGDMKAALGSLSEASGVSCSALSDQRDGEEEG